MGVSNRIGTISIKLKLPYKFSNMISKYKLMRKFLRLLNQFHNSFAPTKHKRIAPKLQTFKWFEGQDPQNSPHYRISRDPRRDHPTQLHLEIFQPVVNYLRSISSFLRFETAPEENRRADGTSRREPQIRLSSIHGNLGGARLLDEADNQFLIISPNHTVSGVCL